MGCSAYFGARRGTISLQSRLRGGEGGIRTLGTGVSPYNGLANRRIRPLCHLSGVRIYSLPRRAGERFPASTTRVALILALKFVSEKALMQSKHALCPAIIPWSKNESRNPLVRPSSRDT